MKLIDDVAFDGAFSFVYSARPGTPAADLVDDARCRKVQSAFEPAAEAVDELFFATHSKAMIGRNERVLVESLSRKGSTELAGRTENNRCGELPRRPQRRTPDRAVRRCALYRCSAT